MAAYRRVDDL